MEAGIEGWMIELQLAKSVERGFGEVAESQRNLVEKLQATDWSQRPLQETEHAAADLDVLVRLATEVIARAKAVPSKWFSKWADKIEEVSDLTEHIESIAESLYMASNGECTRLLCYAAEWAATNIQNRIGNL